MKGAAAEQKLAAHGHYDLAIIGIVGLPGRYGGFETLAENLVGPIAVRHRVLVYCSGASGDHSLQTYRGATLEYLSWRANGWQSVLYDGVAILKSAWRCKTLLILGTSGCLFLPLVRLLAPRLRVVTNIDGIEWRRQKWGRFAQWFLKLSEIMALRCSDVIIADNPGIQSHIKRLYRRESVLIPYGGDHANLVINPTARRSTRFGAGTYFLTVCRIEPENNIEAILEAFAEISERPLVIVGNWNVSQWASRVRECYRKYSNLELLDPIYDLDSLTKIRKESLAYIHGHSAGGTNPSLVEAMCCGLPVLAYDVDYNRYTMAKHGWFWGSAKELVSLVTSIPAEDFETVGRQLQEYANQNYTWDKVIAAYSSLLMAEVPPSAD